MHFTNADRPATGDRVLVEKHDGIFLDSKQEQRIGQEGRVVRPYWSSGYVRVEFDTPDKDDETSYIFEPELLVPAVIPADEPVAAEAPPAAPGLHLFNFIVTAKREDEEGLSIDYLLPGTDDTDLEEYADLYDRAEGTLYKVARAEFDALEVGKQYRVIIELPPVDKA